MAVILTKKQRAILEFIAQCMQRNKFPPTMREIAKGVGLKAVSTVHEHIVQLERRGVIKRDYDGAGGILITDRHLSKRIETSTTIDLPILGRIAAGQPMESFNDPNMILSVAPAFLPANKRCYVLQVKGESMKDAGILDGDYVIVQQSNVARDGEIVVGLIEGRYATLKRFYKEATRIRLEPANSTMSPIFVRDLVIQGKVVGLIRQYNHNQVVN